MQHNLEIVQILRLRGTDICMYIIYQFNSQAEALVEVLFMMSSEILFVVKPTHCMCCQNLIRGLLENMHPSQAFCLPKPQPPAGFQLLSPSMNNSAINIDPHSLDRYFGPKGVHVGKVLLHDEWWPQFVLKSLTLCRSFRQYLGVSPRGMVWM